MLVYRTFSSQLCSDEDLTPQYIIHDKDIQIYVHSCMNRETDFLKAFVNLLMNAFKMSPVHILQSSWLTLHIIYVCSSTVVQSIR